MTIPGSDSSIWATVRDSAREDGSTQGQGAKPQGGAIGDCPTLSRRSLLLAAVSLLPLYVVAAPSPAAAFGLPNSLPNATVQQMKAEADQNVKAVLRQLHKDQPEVFKKVVGTAGGTALGSMVSLTALSLGGPIAGLSAPGITGGLAAAGALVGGGMAVGLGVLAAPVVALGVGGYAIASTIKSRGTKPVMTLGEAIQNLKTIKAHLKPTRYFRSEIAQIDDYIKKLERQKSKVA